MPCSVAVIFHVPWQETNEKISFSLRLDEDGRGVMQPGAQDGLPVQVNGSFEARRPPDIAPGTEINVPMKLTLPVHLPAAATAGCSTSTGTRTIWQLSFETRQTQGAPGMRAAPHSRRTCR